MQLSEYEIKVTLTEASADNLGNSVIDSAQKVYDFDKITEKVAKHYRASKPHDSCDALYIKDEDNVFLVEFKNARSSHVPKKSLKQKAYDSIMTLMCALSPSLSLEETKRKVTLVFVYNNAAGRESVTPSKAMEQMKNKMFKLSNEPKVILFGLEIYKGVFYRDVYTVDKTEFIENIWGKIFP